MTSPFPVHFKGQTLLDPGLSGYLGNAVAGVLAAQQEREKLNREQAEFESKQQYYKTLREGNELDNQKRRDEMSAGKKALEAKSQGLNAYSEWVGGGAKQEALGSIIARIKDPDVAQDFVDRITTHRKQENEAAVLRANAVEADVAEATKGSKISKAGTDAQSSASDAVLKGAQAAEAPAQEKAQTAQLNAQAAQMRATAEKTLAELNAPAPTTPSPAQMNAITTFYRSGTPTLEEAYASQGFNVPAGMNGKQKFEVQTRGMALRKAEQKAAAVSVIAANATLGELSQKGVRISRFTKAKQRVPFDLGRSSIPEPEKQMLQAAEQFVAQYNLSISGKASTDTEFTRNYGTMAPLASDGPNVEKQKLIMREAMEQTVVDAAQGSGRPISEIMQSVIAVAVKKGADTIVRRSLEQSRIKALEYERQLSKMDAVERVSGQTTSPAVVGMDPATPDSLTAILDSVGR